MIENKFYYDEDRINVASYVVGSRALGPGLRAVLWVQGCPFHCKHCFSPAWIPQVPAQIIYPDTLATILTRNSEVEGITISGGEPLLQARKLILLIKEIRKIKLDYSFILYSGFKRVVIDRLPDDDPKRLLVSTVDVLIDGLYIDELNDNSGLRGSSNQHIWHITNRYKKFDFVGSSRKSEIVIKDGEVQFIGVPNYDMAVLTRKMEQDYVWT